MTLTRVENSRDGSCGIRSGTIACTRKLVAHGCGCRQHDLVVNFTATGHEPKRAIGPKGEHYWIYYGLVTPFLDQAPPSFTDVNFCDIGQKSTKQHPCIK
jgi:hypothetical protein